MMAVMNFPAGTHTKMGSDRKDTRRLRSSIKTSSEQAKRRRKATKMDKLTAEASKKQKEGTTYSAGSF